MKDKLYKRISTLYEDQSSFHISWWTVTNKDCLVEAMNGKIINESFLNIDNCSHLPDNSFLLL